MNPPGANLNPCNVQVPLFLEKWAEMSSLETLLVVSIFSNKNFNPLDNFTKKFALNSNV